ncbi:AMP-binding protein [Catellatospora bangladeshensis]|uniref:AMP-binding protein n=1 Tax=Catellatospora bangladeshensis TaxID=310355 RepID=UPI0036150DD4
MTPRTLPELLAALAAARPEHVALRLVTGPGQGAGLTARDWHTRSVSAGHGLLGKGVAPGDRVGLVFGGHGWLDYAVAYAAVTGVGAVAVPISAKLPPPASPSCCPTAARRPWSARTAGRCPTWTASAKSRCLPSSPDSARRSSTPPAPPARPRASPRATPT